MIINFDVNTISHKYCGARPFILVHKDTLKNPFFVIVTVNGGDTVLCPLSNMYNI